MAAKQQLKQLESRLQETYKKGKETNDYVGGYGGGHLTADSFEAVQQHEQQRRELVQEVKRARDQAKQEKQAVKEQAGAIHDAGNWTAKASWLAIVALDAVE